MTPDAKTIFDIAALQTKLRVFLRRIDFHLRVASITNDPDRQSYHLTLAEEIDTVAREVELALLKYADSHNTTEARDAQDALRAVEVKGIQ